MAKLMITVEADGTRLGKALGVDAPNVMAKAGLIARAGAREGLAQATGEAVFSSITDLRCFRIYCLFSEGMVVDEADDLVARVFQVPLSTAKRLVGAALARYKIDLEKEVADLEKKTLELAAWLKRKDRWRMTIPPVLVTSFMERARRANQPDPENAGAGYTWDFADETYQALRGAIGLPSRPKPIR